MQQKSWSVLAVVLGIIIAACVAALITSCGPTPKPGQRECWQHKDCLACVQSYCGWCESGCYSLHEGPGCAPPIAYVGDCPDFPFPKTPPYLRFKRDGGAKKNDGATDAR